MSSARWETIKRLSLCIQKSSWPSMPWTFNHLNEGRSRFAFSSWKDGDIDMHAGAIIKPVRLYFMRSLEAFSLMRKHGNDSIMESPSQSSNIYSSLDTRGGKKEVLPTVLGPSPPETSGSIM